MCYSSGETVRLPEQGLEGGAMNVLPRVYSGVNRSSLGVSSGVAFQRFGNSSAIHSERNGDVILLPREYHEYEEIGNNIAAPIIQNVT